MDGGRRRTSDRTVATTGRMAIRPYPVMALGNFNRTGLQGDAPLHLTAVGVGLPCDRSRRLRMGRVHWWHRARWWSCACEEER